MFNNTNKIRFNPHPTPTPSQRIFALTSMVKYLLQKKIWNEIL